MLAIILFALAIIGFASGETAYDINTVVELALRENSSLKRDTIELGALSRKAHNSRAFAAPSVSVGASLGKAEDATATIGEGTATATISASASSIAAIRQSRLAYEACAANHEASVREVELAARKAFYAILYERDYLDYIRATVETAQEQYELTMEREREGLIPKLDGLAAKVNLENGKLALGTEENAYEGALASLKQSLGVPQSESMTLRGSLDGLLVSDISATGAIASPSPSYAALRKKLMLAQQERKDANISIWSPVFSCSITAKQPFLSRDTNAESLQFGISGAVAFQISDILPWSAAREAAFAADDSVRDMEIQLNSQATADSVRKDSLYRDIEHSKRAIETCQMAVSLADESYRLTMVAFKSGSKDFITLKSATDALREAKAGMMRERYALISSILDLEYVCGVPFGTLGRIQ